MDGGVARPPLGEVAVVAAYGQVVLEDEPCQEARRRPTCLLGEHPPQRQIGRAREEPNRTTVGLDLEGPQNGCAGVAWASFRFWSQLSRAAPENGACDEARHQRHRQRFAPARLEAPTTPPDPRGVGMSAASAGQPVEHPGRQFLPAGRVRATIAAQDIAGRLFDHLLDANNASSPGVPRIKDLTLLSALGPVGVPPPGCTTADPTQPLAENHPSPACPRTTSLEVTPSPLDWLETQPLARVRKPLRPSIVARSQPPRSSCGRSRGRFGVSASVSRA